MRKPRVTKADRAQMEQEKAKRIEFSQQLGGGAGGGPGRPRGRGGLWGRCKLGGCILVVCLSVCVVFQPIISVLLPGGSFLTKALGV